jgi:large conductance mechanosensitive channel
MGGIDFTEQAYIVGNAVFGYGAFIQAVIDFTIVAFVIFMIVKGINSLQRKEAAKPEAEKVVEPSEEVQLLREIRDGLKK